MACNRVSSLTFSLGLLLGLLSHSPSPVNAQFSNPNQGTPVSPEGRTLQFSPPDRGAPESAEGGATRRSDCIHVVPLMPVDDHNVHFGLTYQEHPSLYWYIGSAKAGLETAKIIIERDSNNGDIEEVHRVSLDLPSTLNEQEHILRFSAPSDEPGLEVGESYRWYLEIHCNPVNVQDPTRLMTYEGWIERVEPEPELAAELEAASDSQEQAYLYGTAGIWFDYLHEMVSSVDAWPYILSGFEVIKPETTIEILDNTAINSNDGPLGAEHMPTVEFFSLVRDFSSRRDISPDMGNE